MGRLAGGLVFIALAVGLAGCGKSESEKESEAAGRGEVTCEGVAMSKSPSLPAGFPSVGKITFVKGGAAGPSTSADGYSDTDLDAMHDDYVSGFKSAGYTVLFEELEEDDSEVSYKTADGSKSGQVALRKCDNGKTSVHITVRPS